VEVVEYGRKEEEWNRGEHEGEERRLGSDQTIAVSQQVQTQTLEI
jgi:hypothetical protein